MHGTTEESKVAVRNIRRDALHQSKDLARRRKSPKTTSDRAGSEVDNLAKKYVDEAEKIGKAKEQEVLEV